jgi:uncharacterized integral membrane protein
VGIRTSTGATTVTDPELTSSGETHEIVPLAVTASSEGTPSPTSVPAAPEARVNRRTRASSPDGVDVRHTRISGAWAAVAVTTVLGVALVDFIVENTHSVEIHFFSVAGRISVAAALLAAALAGAAVVLTIGVARTAQLRMSIRHHRRAREAASAAASDDANVGAEATSN